MYLKHILLTIATSVALIARAALPAGSDSIEVVVHRGANHLAPENTFSSTFSALSHHAQWIEIDVRCSKDSVLYNLHDPWLDRTTNGTGPIASRTSQYIDRLDAGSWFAEEFKDCRVPRVSEMLDTLRGRARVFFDVKSGTPISKLVNMVRAKGFTEQSFFWFADTAMLKLFVIIAPEMKVKVNANDTLDIERWSRMCRPAYIEIAPKNITPALIHYCHLRSIKVMAAIQGSDEKAYAEAIAAKPDMVNLDRPELFEAMYKLNGKQRK